MDKAKAYNVTISDPGRGSFTVGYWVVERKSEAVAGAKQLYPGHKKYVAVAACNLARTVVPSFKSV